VELAFQCGRHFFAVCVQANLFPSNLYHNSFLISFVHKSLLLILSGQCTLTILCKHLLMKTCSLFVVLCVNVKDSDACSKTAFTLELNILILLARIYGYISTIYPIHRPETDLAFPNLASTSCSVPPMVLTTLPRYVNSWTSSTGPGTGVERIFAGTGEDGNQPLWRRVSRSHGRHHGFESGGDNFASGASRKKILTPTFWPVGGQNIA